jgi:hypothetical protein
MRKMGVGTSASRRGVARRRARPCGSSRSRYWLYLLAFSGSPTRRSPDLHSRDGSALVGAYRECGRSPAVAQCARRRSHHRAGSFFLGHDRDSDAGVTAVCVALAGCAVLALPPSELTGDLAQLAGQRVRRMSRPMDRDGCAPNRRAIERSTAIHRTGRPKQPA